ncbi:glutathione S-transferase family protein [Cyanobium sp. WAJ14-Wanaka]|uniref:glutathione S-transferase family protein n=1 Tax=Cyanobium sp. WAJ14-Wanaka TaxID=2823725 RepID=UPI0020CC935C|nr:glutathione S-transferase family protein [Cyanobium sp. WAJ14-Wanaka]MCP9774295.1 glutathione S-transferase family protein [Cyanobium sp. WAJ14-Wanaka]
MGDQELVLLHAAPSYYSMVARLALVEAGVAFCSQLIDIHLAKQQLGDRYRQLNPAMTVPTLCAADWSSPGARIWTDSRDILTFASQSAAATWLDFCPNLRDQIADVVAGHYAISIEDLTFGKAILSNPVLKRIVPKLLQSLVDGLERRAEGAADGGASLRAKAQQNRERLAYFSQGSQLDKLDLMRTQVGSYLASLPLVTGGPGLFGDRPSSADVVVAVLFARLEMIQELDLEARPDLQAWWLQFQQRKSFRQAEIWTRFRRRRFVQAIFVAKLGPRPIPV